MVYEFNYIFKMADVDELGHNVETSFHLSGESMEEINAKIEKISPPSGWISVRLESITKEEI